MDLKGLMCSPTNQLRAAINHGRRNPLRQPKNYIIRYDCGWLNHTLNIELKSIHHLKYKRRIYLVAIDRHVVVKLLLSEKS
jgi:hypothetical protein